jgi:fructokinase
MEHRDPGNSTTVDDRFQQIMRPMIFGEVLFDVFPDATVIGGAPFNVAWHLHGFGLNPLFVSRVGDDPAGERALTIMRSWGMDISCVQIDTGHPTGEVQVALKDDGGHEFTILPDCAYDYIDAATVMRAGGAHAIELIYHGTLALRSNVSRSSLFTLCQQLRVPRCIDINLRSPWWGMSEVKSLIDGADWVKLNDEELMLVGDETMRASAVDESAPKLRRSYGIGTLIVTRGAKGALIVDDNGVVEGDAAKVGEIVDTVGAGDAFAAVALIGLMHRWEAGVTLRRALEFASWICTLRGAVVDAPEHYHRFMHSWEVEPV